MATLNAAVLIGADDGEWYAGGWNNNNINMTVGKQGGANPSNAFIRFDNLTFDASVINSAYMSLRAAANDSDATALRIYAELANDPTAVTSIANGNGRTRTTAFVNWNPGTVVSGTYYNTPDLSTIIQELVDAGYVYSGTQAIQFFIQDNGSASNVNRVFRTYDHSSTLSEPQLTVDYTPSNTPPTITPNTADGEVFFTNQPSLEFTGNDAESDNLTYEIEISDRDDFIGSGSFITDSHTSGASGIIHPNPVGSLTWQGFEQVDDRPGQSFQSQGGGVLDKARVTFGPDADTDGTVFVRVYAHQGVYGTSSEPLNAASPANTPTPDWLAESDHVAFNTGGSGGWHEFTFSGANRIRLEAGQSYVLVLDWRPNNTLYDNTITVSVDAIVKGHGGNCYIDGASVPNNGVFDADMLFEVYEELTLITAASDTDPGFLNTVNGADTDPFTAGQMISYTVQPADALTADVVYYWRVRCIDPSGSALPSAWSTTRTFTYDDGNTPPTIAQDTADLTTFTTLLPTLLFTGSDVDLDPLTYQIQIYEGITLIVDALSDTDPGFLNEDDNPDTDPFTAGDQISYTVQSDLTDLTSYTWRVRCNDPGGAATWSAWSAYRTFDISLPVPGSSTAVVSKLTISIGMGL